MRDAFAVLGMAPCLVVDKDELNSHFREAGKSLHPDAGGGDEGFAELQAAYELVSSPAKRLKHWLELKGCEVDTRGAIDSAMMDLFGSVGEVTQKAEALIRKKQSAKSALGVAMLEGETHICREAVEDINRQIERAIAYECASFGELENAVSIDETYVAKRVRNLIFLEKWQATMRSLYSRLV